MKDIPMTTNSRVIQAECVIPCEPGAVWKTLTTRELIAQWIKMPLGGFEPVPGNSFTFQTTPAGGWDGLIKCKVVDLVVGKRLCYTWESGDEGNVGYGSHLRTLVAWNLEPSAEGTRLGLTHTGFILPKNETTHKALSGGWEAVVRNIREVALTASA